MEAMQTHLIWIKSGSFVLLESKRAEEERSWIEELEIIQS